MTNPNNSPKISILCPILNVNKYISTMIESVLKQNFQNWELIIMDGRSKDGTVETIMNYAKKDSRIRAYSEADESPWHAVDKMFDLARGEFITIVCGQDGLLDPEWLKVAADVLDKDKEISLVWALSREMYDDGKLAPDIHPTYSHFINQESGPERAKHILNKAGQTLKTLFSGDLSKKKFLINKIFSRGASLRFKSFTKRSFPGGKVPQKTDWLQYWLTTGLVFPDQSMIVSKKVFLNCVPRYEMGSRTLGYMTDFYFNFNRQGYLPYYLPMQAVFARTHPAQSGERRPGEMYDGFKKYLTQVLSLKERILKNHESFDFRDREGNIISSHQF